MNSPLKFSSIRLALVMAILAPLPGQLAAQTLTLTQGAQVLPVVAPSMRLEFETRNDRYYQIQSSDDLKTWNLEGYSFAGNGGRMAAMVSNHGLPRLFYRVAVMTSPGEIAPLNPYMSSGSTPAAPAAPVSWAELTAKPTNLTDLGVGAGTADFLREAGASGFNALTSDNKHVWRIIEKINRERAGQGSIARDRFRSVSFGDSVAVHIFRQASGFWGYGGNDGGLQFFVKQAPPNPSTEENSTYPSWSSGVFTLYDEWHRAPGGILVHLDANIPGGQHVERTNFPAPMHSVVVTYMTRDSTGAADASYGKFKLQYRPNHTGAWIDCTSATASAERGSAVAGVVNTDNDAPGERIGVAVFNLPRSDTYSIRLVATEGRVRLTKVLFNNGGLAVGPSGQEQLGGSLEANFALGGRGIASHFSKMTQQALNDALGYINPHVVLYKSANEWSLDRYELYWPELAAKLMRAAPNATLIVAGSHPQNAKRGHFDEAILVDDYLRAWCARTPGAIFVDIRQNFPEFQDGFAGASDSIDDLWSDGVHIYDKGSEVVSQLVWDSVKPAMEYAKIVQNSIHNSSNILPMVPTEIRLFDERPINNRTNKLAFTVHPRAPSSLMIRSTNAQFFGGNQSWYWETGIWARAATDLYPNALTLFSDGSPALSFGHHPTLHPLQGLAVGVAESHAANAHRAANGYRFRVPWPIYGMKNGLIVEGRDDSPADSRLLGIDVDSTDSAEGNRLWSWMEDGKVIYEGNIPDTNRTTLLYAEPLSQVTITTPAKTGTIGVVPAFADEAAARGSGLGAGDNYWNTTTGSLKTILP
jgi:hypothetical protein